MQVKTVELKKLVYTYLVHYADANPTCRELALLAIASFQRDLGDSNQLIRALALRVLCSIRVREIVMIQVLSVKKASSDRCAAAGVAGGQQRGVDAPPPLCSSPYVRKSAAHCVGKIFQSDPEVQPDLIEILERLLSGASAAADAREKEERRNPPPPPCADKSTAVLSSAMAAFQEVCPTRLDLFHPHFRKFAHLLADFDEWGQTVALGILTRYVRENFAKPELPEAAGAAGRARARVLVWTGGGGLLVSGGGGLLVS